MKVSFWTILGSVGSIAANLTEAIADDGKISIPEIIDISVDLVDSLGIDMVDDSIQYLDALRAISDWLESAGEDNVVNIREIVELMVGVVESLGYDIEDGGFEL